MPSNPYQTPKDSDRNRSDANLISPDLAAQNIIADTITGPNLRWSDNKLQAMFIFGCILMFALVGAVLAMLMEDWNLPWFGGALIGAFLGMVVGVFTSGIFLMIYRAARHIKGQHD